jgi:hypothetical protein
MACDGTIPVFTDRDIVLIDKSLPDMVDRRRRELLPKILPDWNSNELSEYVLMAGGPTPERRERMVVVKDCASELLRSLKATDEVDRAGIAGEMVRAAGQSSLITGWSAVTTLIQRINEEVSFLAKLEEAASRTWRRSRGHPRNTAAYLVLLDAAAIFEWLTDKRATREGDGSSDHETDPPFRRFAAAIWPVVFANGDYGLSSAMKNWATWRKEHDEESSLMFNINMRHPQWGVFER